MTFRVTVSIFFVQHCLPTKNKSYWTFLPYNFYTVCHLSGRLSV